MENNEELKVEDGQNVVENLPVETENIISEVAENVDLGKDESISTSLPETEEKPKTTKRKRVKSDKSSTDKKSDADDDSDEQELADVPEVIESYENYSTEELVNILEELIKEPDFSLIKNKVGYLKIEFRNKIQKEKEEFLEKFIAEGGEKTGFNPKANPLEERFYKAFDVYSKKRIKFREQQENQKQENLTAKKKVLDDLKTLVESEETLKRTYDDFKNLQNKWKEIGTVPKNENNNLWQNYHFLVEKFLDKVKINKELKDLDLRKNLELKIELCEKVEELLLEPSIIKSYKKLQKFHETWKEIGPIPEDKKDEVWERFKSVTDNIHERRRTFYEDQKKERDNNLQAKSAICEKVEQVNSKEYKSQKEWRDATDEILEAQKLWRTIGIVPEQQNGEIWQRFRTAINLFFENKKEFFDKIQDNLTNNYHLKLDICTQAEALKDSQDWNRTTRELINLQKEWKNIGPIPNKHSETLWQRFRTACDAFFNTKENYFKNVDSIEVENLKKKQELIKKVNEYPFGENNKENMEILKGFQREWVEIGHVPLKEKENLQNEFKTAVNKQFEKLKISSFNKNVFEYQSRIDSIKDSKEGEKFIFREKSFIQSNIQKIKGDINLWENNIGFLAKSKNADAVKEEFLKKIEKAKAELKEQEQKLNYFNQQEKAAKSGN